MTRARDIASGLGPEAGEGKPHIIPGVLYPAVSGNDINGTDIDTSHGSTYTYGTAHADGRKYYYTDIKGSKPIRDPRIGAHFGSQRHKFKSLQLLEQETATHGKNVYSVDGREWIRAVGDIEIQNATNGLIFNINDTTTFFEITGYFNQFNWLEYLSQSGSARNRWILSVDGTATTTESANQVSVDSPLGGRYVDAVSVRNINTGLTIPRIVTIKMTTNSASDNAWAGGCELIAQDTTSTANRSKIQIPSQDVVSYGKEFNVSGTPHYDPFTTMSYGGSGTTLSALQSLIDTDTSLGMDAWKAGTSNYHRPWNGGRVIRWVDSSGVIKTSVNMMPPNAQNIGTTASNAVSDAHVIAGTNDDTINFNTSAIDHTQSEVAKTFYWREFGNGSANGGTGSGSYADASMLSGTADDIAYVMDDGLTTLSGASVVANNHPIGYANTTNKGWYFTFIGTGFTFIGRADGSNVPSVPVSIVQNLPYGSHIVKIFAKSDDHEQTVIHVDGVQIYSAKDLLEYAGIVELTIHQPKRPPIPEEAVVLADYMLMADYVGITDSEWGYISKGVRRLSGTRDVFYDTTGLTANNAPTAVTLSPDNFREFGYRPVNTHTNNGLDCSVPFFGTKLISYAGYSHDSGGTDPRKTFINGSEKTTGASQISHLDNSAGAAGDATALLETQTLGVNVVKQRIRSGGYNFQGFDFASPIHTSFHYTDGNKANPKTGFETPLLNELVGGDRNLEQHTLICSPDGKTWDQLTRDTSYLGNMLLSASNSSMTSDGDDTVNTYNEWRGKDSNGRRDYFNKDFAIAYDRLICLKDGQYNISVRGYAANRWGDQGKIFVNNVLLSPMYDNDSYGVFSNFVNINLIRGDYITIKGKTNNSESYNKLEITRL